MTVKTEEPMEVELISIEDVNVVTCNICGAKLTDENEVIEGCLYECDRDAVSKDRTNKSLNFNDY